METIIVDSDVTAVTETPSPPLRLTAPKHGREHLRRKSSDRLESYTPFIRRLKVSSRAEPFAGL